ncbi:MAG: outer membrane beta-barrel protein [Rhodospirillales bacterium]
MTISVTRWAASAGAICLAGVFAAPAFAQAPAAPAPAAPAAPPAVTLNAPGMDGPLSWPTNPYSVDVGPLGKWYVDAAVTGLGYVQSDRIAGDRNASFDLSNGQVFIQKVDGWWQFYAQVGAYSLPVLGAPYVPNDSSHALNNFFSAVPQAFLKIVPAENFSIIAGKLPTLIGAEYTFTFENFNIERGLLWNQEPAVSRGVQGSYVAGPVTVNLSLTDGYYSNRYNWITGSVAWAINPTNTLTFAAGGNMGHTVTNQFATPTPQNNSSIYNLIYTYNSAPWTITPYLQVQDVPKNTDVGILKGATAWSGALLVSYAIDSNWSIGARGEFITTDGDAADGAPNITFYGPGSKAWSLTVTPTWQYNRFFARGEFSVVAASSITPGLAFGTNGTDKTQFRGLLETGILF